MLRLPLFIVAAGAAPAPPAPCAACQCQVPVPFTVERRIKRFLSRTSRGSRPPRSSWYQRGSGCLCPGAVETFLAVTDQEVALLRLGPGGVRNGRPGEMLARVPRSEVALARVSAGCSLVVTSGCLLPRCLLDSV